jgi:hypothetical protein
METQVAKKSASETFQKKAIEEQQTMSSSPNLSVELQMELAAIRVKIMTKNKTFEFYLYIYTIKKISFIEQILI